MSRRNNRHGNQDHPFQHSAAHARDSVAELGADGPALLRALGLRDADIDALCAQGALHLGMAAAHG